MGLVALVEEGVRESSGVLAVHPLFLHIVFDDIYSFFV